MKKHQDTLDELGGSNCENADQAMTAANFLNRGKILLATSRYEPALSCFLEVQQREVGTTVFKEACIAIGTMYELGWGVEKDAESAMPRVTEGGL